MSFSSTTGEYTDKSAWNLSQALLWEIQLHLQSASNNYLAGHIDKWYFCLKAIKFRIISNLNMDERLKLKVLEHEISIDLQKWKKNTNEVDVVDKIEAYNEMLFDLMEVYGLLLKKEKDNTRIN